MGKLLDGLSEVYDSIGNSKRLQSKKLQLELNEMENNDEKNIRTFQHRELIFILNKILDKFNKISKQLDTLEIAVNSVS